MCDAALNQDFTTEDADSEFSKKTIEWLKEFGWKKLEHFAFPGTTVMDFDIRPIVGVTHVYSKNNKNYNLLLRGQELIANGQK